MTLFRVSAAALLSAAACTAENAVAGKWNCMNVPESGPEKPWTLMIREDSSKLAGLLTDGEAKVPLSDIKADEGKITFGFDINDKPYVFEGKFDSRRLEGRFSGQEASGKLRCDKSAD